MGSYVLFNFCPRFPRRKLYPSAFTTVSKLFKILKLSNVSQKIAVKIKRSLQGSPVENTHKMLRSWMGKKRSGGVGGIPFYRVGIYCPDHDGDDKV